MDLKKLMLLSLACLVILTGSVVVANNEDDEAHFWYAEIDNMQNCSYEVLTSSLESIHYFHRNLTQLTKIGTSVEGRELWNLIVTNQTILEYNSKGEKEFFKKQIKYVGNINGYSGPACVTLVKLAKYLANLPANSPSDSFILDFGEIHIVPNLNPDGYAKSVPGDCTSISGRPNANGINLNSNFPDDYNAPDPFEASDWIMEQPETSAVRQWIEQNNFVLSASLTSGTTKILYPWGMAPDSVPQGHKFDVPTPDVEAFVSLCHQYIHPLNNSGYKWGCEGEVRMDTHYMNAAEVKRVSGSMMDYNYNNGVQEILIGLGCCINDNRSDMLNEIFYDHSKPLIHMIIETIFSYRRRVVDGNTGKPLEKVKIVPILVNGEPIVGGESMPLYTDRNGIFGRFFEYGSYVFEITYREYSSIILQVEIPADIEKTLTIEDETIKMIKTEQLPEGEHFVDIEASEGHKDETLFVVKEQLESLKPIETQWYNRTAETESSSSPPNSTSATQSPNGAAVLQLPKLIKILTLIPVFLYFSNKILLSQ